MENKTYILAKGARSVWGALNFENLQTNLVIFLENKNSLCKFIKGEIVESGGKMRPKATLICSCGNIFTSFVESIVGRDIITCPSCAKIRAGKTHTFKSRTEKGKERLEELEQAGYKLLEKKLPQSRNEYIEVEDDEGYRGFLRIGKIKEKCGVVRFDRKRNEKNYIYNVNNYCVLHGIEAECIGFCEEEKWQSQGLYFKCQCGEKFSTSVWSFVRGKRHCDKCTNFFSNYELRFKQFLEEEKIAYIQQYSFLDCKTTRPLPFDFFVKKYNLLVEIDGEGHYWAVRFNGMEESEAQKHYEKTKQHDKIKTEYCFQHNIHLLRISYLEMQDNSYKEKFQNFIRELTNSN